MEKTPTAPPVPTVNRRAFVLGALALSLSGCGGSDSESDEPRGWRRLADAPTLRTEVAAAALGNLIYVAGGYGPTGASVTAVEVYDPARDRWSAAPPLPQPRNHLALVSLNGALYAVGGYGPPDNNPVPTQNVWRYTTGATEWTEVSPLPLPRGAHAAVAAAGRIVVVGGVGPEDTRTFAFDPAANAWQDLAPIASGREHLAAAEAAGGGVLAVGGRVGTSNLATSEQYVPAVNQWQAAAPLPLARSGLTAVTLGGRIYVTGGETLDGSGITFARLDVYDPASGTWQEGAPLPSARHGLGGVAYGGRFYTFAGGPVAGLSVSGITEAFTP